MVKQKPGYKITGTLDLENLEYIDLSRLYQAARVNFSKYKAHFSPDQEEEINYLSFVSPGGNQTASGYFIHAFGCEKGSPSAKATEAVINGSWDFFTQHDDFILGALIVFRGTVKLFLDAPCGASWEC